MFEVTKMPAFDGCIDAKMLHYVETGHGNYRVDHYLVELEMENGSMEVYTRDDTAPPPREGEEWAWALQRLDPVRLTSHQTGEMAEFHGAVFSLARHGSLRTTYNLSIEEWADAVHFTRQYTRALQSTGVIREGGAPGEVRIDLETSEVVIYREGEPVERF